MKTWTEEEEKELTRIYQEKELDIFEIANRFNKGHRSVISKLVKLGIYRKPEKEDKNTVKSIILRLEQMFGVDLEGGINKKSNLVKLFAAIERTYDNRDIG